MKFSSRSFRFLLPLGVLALAGGLLGGCTEVVSMSTIDLAPPPMGYAAEDHAHFAPPVVAIPPAPVRPVAATVP